MEYRRLGRNGPLVSRLCFGSLVMGPLQAGLSMKEGAGLILEAAALGVNFIDTAEIYETYGYIKEALRLAGETGEMKSWPTAGGPPGSFGDGLVIASKCYAYTWEGMEDSLRKAQREIGRDVIDIFMLHEQESELTLRGHRPAIERLIKAKEDGDVRFIGISTHCVNAVLAATSMPEIDVIHPLINKRGLGIKDGSLEEMLAAVKAAHDAGKGIYAMKALGGGHLAREAEEALGFVRDLDFVDSIAVGVRSVEELRMNVAILQGTEVPSSLKEKIRILDKHVHVEEWCQGCGKCVEACPQQALTLVSDETPPVRVEHSKCVLCGYCAARCPDFFIKVY
ncbi:MAG TPA: 4Fe-4S binding protein [Clostridia bacterium]|nr:4Fe-4S binding protein [Clostridia bacterium]